MQEIQQKGEAWKSVAPPLQHIQRKNEFTINKDTHTHTLFSSTQQTAFMFNSKGKERDIYTDVVQKWYNDHLII